MKIIMLCLLSLSFVACSGMGTRIQSLNADTKRSLAGKQPGTQLAVDCFIDYSWTRGLPEKIDPILLISHPFLLVMTAEEKMLFLDYWDYKLGIYHRKTRHFGRGRETVTEQVRDSSPIPIAQIGFGDIPFVQREYVKEIADATKILKNKIVNLRRRGICK